jgi:hypothetical protein
LHPDFTLVADEAALSLVKDLLQERYASANPAEAFNAAKKEKPKEIKQ